MRKPTAEEILFFASIKQKARDSRNLMAVKRLESLEALAYKYLLKVEEMPDGLIRVSKPGRTTVLFDYLTGKFTLVGSDRPNGNSMQFFLSLLYS